MVKQPLCAFCCVCSPHCNRFHLRSVIFLRQLDQIRAFNSRLLHLRFVFRRNPVQNGGCNHFFLRESGVLFFEFPDHIHKRFSRGDLIVHQNYTLGICQPLRQLIPPELLFHRMAVLFQEFNPLVCRRKLFPRGVDIYTVRCNALRHHRSNGSGRFRKTNHQFRLGIFPRQQISQGFHHVRCLRRPHRDVLCLQGIHQEVRPFRILKPLGNAKGIVARIIRHTRLLTAIINLLFNHLLSRCLPSQKPKAVPQMPPTICIKLAT